MVQYTREIVETTEPGEGLVEGGGGVFGSTEDSRRSCDALRGNTIRGDEGLAQSSHPVETTV